MAAQQIHIVTTMQEIRGNEYHALNLCALLRSNGAKVNLWSDRPGPYAKHMGATEIHAFSGKLPRGGTLVLLGVWLALDPWINVARPERIVLICNTSDAPRFFSMLGRLKRAGLPAPDLVYVSQRLKETMLMPGYVCPTLINLEQFRPRPQITSYRKYPVLGRHSRDASEKHHPDDPSLYRMLAWKGWTVRIMGGTCLGSAIPGPSSIELLATGAEPSHLFLHSLDIFFYRIHPAWSEAGGRVVLEAMAAGLPVVAHVSGGYTDWIVHGESGFLFSSQEEALDHLLKLADDLELRLRIGEAARKRAETLAGKESDPVVAYLGWLTGQRNINEAPE